MRAKYVHTNLIAEDWHQLANFYKMRWRAIGFLHPIESPGCITPCHPALAWGNFAISY